MRRFAQFMMLVVCILSSTALAWGREGHQIVAAISQQHLSLTARNELQKLLGSSHIYDDNVAAWADGIRRDRPETGPWHYVDILISDDTFDFTRDCGDGTCVVAKIQDYRSVLGDSTASRAERLEALRFLVHFVGDIHQPLHAADDHDRGGNNVRVNYPGTRRRANLHGTWDSLVLHDAMGDQDVLAYADALDRAILQKDIQTWVSNGGSQPEQWANESHNAAQLIYRALPAVDANGTRTLARDYGTSNKTMLETQLKRGGIRLAMVLNAIFAQDTQLLSAVASGDASTERVPLFPAEQRQRLIAHDPRD